MRKRLSALPYITNNKGRVFALVLSLALCAAAIYILGYFSGSITESFDVPVRGLYDKITSFYCPTDIAEDDRPWEERTKEALNERNEEYRKILGEDVYVARRSVYNIKSSVGISTISVFLFEEEKGMERYMETVGAKLIEGRLPEKKGEIAVDEMSIRNCGEKGVTEYLSKGYKVVGKVSCGHYTAFGYPVDAENNFMHLALRGKGDPDVKTLLEGAGYEITYLDGYQNRTEEFEKETKSMNSIKMGFSYVSTAILCLCVVVILSLHIRDRHEEWCLMNSIGFPVAEIYGLAVRELLICFGLAALLAVIISGIGVTAFDSLMMRPLGLEVRSFRPEDIALSFTMLLMIFAACEIPLFLNIRKITTIDEIE